VQAAVAQERVKKKIGGRLFEKISVPNEEIAEFQHLVNTKAAAIWVQDDRGVFTKTFGDSPLCQMEVQKAVKAACRFKGWFEGPQAALWERALHGCLKR
jgi:hypothetical protein